MPSSVALLVLASGMRLHGLGDVPNAEKIQHSIAFYEDRCEQTCLYKPELVKVRSVACRALSRRTILGWNEWDAEGGARCSYAYAIPDVQGRYRWRKVREVFILRRIACGGEGQEADLWCLTWNVHKPPKP